MKWIITGIRWIVVLGVLAGLGGCRNQSEGGSPEPRNMAALKPTTRPGAASTTPAGSGDTQTMSLLPPGHFPVGSNMPSGHPPIGGSALPSGHPAIASGDADMGLTDPDAEAGSLIYTAPEGWVPKPARRTTKAIYALPKAENDPEDADLAISFYPGMKNIPIERHITRWAGQFSQPDGRPTGEVLKRTQLEGTAHPTTLVDITGQYQGGSMFGPKEPAKDNFRALTALIETPEGPWFFKLVGPVKTVAKHEDAFMKFVREAK